jgi:hypothetical protein
MLTMLCISIIVAGTFNYMCYYYIPIISKVPFSCFAKPENKYFSPRLFFVKRILGKIDVVMCLFLFFGGLLGIKEAGINMLLYEAFVGVGLTVGLNIMRRIFVPRWQAQFEKEKEMMLC